MKSSRLWRAVLRAGLVCLMASCVALTARAQGAASPSGYITGTVQGTQGPEAGVWVIAETKDLPTNFIKIVVTDDDAGAVALQDLRQVMQIGLGDDVEGVAFALGPDHEVAVELRPAGRGVILGEAGGEGPGQSR